MTLPLMLLALSMELMLAPPSAPPLALLLVLVMGLELVLTLIWLFWQQVLLLTGLPLALPLA